MIDADVSNYSDSLSHIHLRAFLDLRIKYGVVRRMIDKWLKAGVLEEGVLRRTRSGTPQGGLSARCFRTSSCTMRWMRGSSGRRSPGCEGREELMQAMARRGRPTRQGERAEPSP